MGAAEGPLSAGEGALPMGNREKTVNDNFPTPDQVDAAFACWMQKHFPGDGFDDHQDALRQAWLDCADWMPAVRQGAKSRSKLRTATNACATGSKVTR